MTKVEDGAVEFQQEELGGVADLIAAAAVEAETAVGQIAAQTGAPQSEVRQIVMGPAIQAIVGAYLGDRSNPSWKIEQGKVKPGKVRARVSVPEQTQGGA